jgi:hypothetical protein
MAGLLESERVNLAWKVLTSGLYVRNQKIFEAAEAVVAAALQKSHDPE